MSELFINGMDLEPELVRLKELVNKHLDSYLPPIKEEPGRLHEAMRYSVFAGGKRMRPILTLMAAQAVGADPRPLVGPASAVELFHTYTLIHDDLPCMDDDDLRRGKPSCHKVFGESLALLAGDALQSAAFDMLIKKGREANLDAVAMLKVTQELAQAAGSLGVVAGQVQDLHAEGRDISIDELQNIHRQKTGELFVYAVRAGAILGGASDEDLEKITGFGEYFGLLFQITDDILDVVGDEQKLGKPIGSDAEKKKATYPQMLTLDGAWKIAEETASGACDFLTGLSGDCAPLYSLSALLLSRES